MSVCLEEFIEQVTITLFCFSTTMSVCLNWYMINDMSMHAKKQSISSDNINPRHCVEVTPSASYHPL
jgi:hypothetical protein